MEVQQKEERAKWKGEGMPSTFEQVDWSGQALATYRDAKGDAGSEDVEILRDLLKDLRHWADWNNVDYLSTMRLAMVAYGAEIHERQASQRAYRARMLEQLQAEG